MPVVFLYMGGAAVAGLIGGYMAGRGVSSVNNAVKYAVIGAGLVFAAKEMKVLK